MQQSFSHRPSTAPAVLGVALIAVGAAALILREVGVNLFASIGPWGWPLFIIVPGLVLLVASLIPAPPRGLGFAIAGAIVTAVGSLLLYQSQTGHWESWAYAWALLPMSAGVAMVLYGTLAGARRLVTNGLWLAGIAGAILAVGAWYFEAVFAGRPPLLDAGNWWPVAVIVIGAIVLMRALLFPTRSEPARPTTAPATAGLQEPADVSEGAAPSLDRAAKA
jgi:hypothetical protein